MICSDVGRVNVGGGECVGSDVAVAALLVAAEAATGGGEPPLRDVADVPLDRGLVERAFAAAGGTRPCVLERAVSVLTQVRLPGAADPAPPSGDALPPERVASFRKALAARARDHGGQTVSGLLTWLERTAADLPWGSVSDVPLVIGARSAAAFAEVFAKGDGICLVGGDLFGVQRFLYTGREQGALRSLRGRSFFLDLLVEDMQADLLARQDLSPACSIYAGGGRFFVLAPAETAAETAEQVQAQYGDWLFSAFGGTLGAVLACVELASDADRAWHALGRQLGRAKLRRFASVLVDSTSWEPLDPEPECALCGAERRDLQPLRADNPGVLACTHCRGFYEAGAVLPDLRAVVRGTQGVPDTVTVCLGTRVWSLLTTEAAAPRDVPVGAELIWRLGAGFTDTPGDPRIRRLDLAECTARKPDGSPATLDELAATSTGASHLGTLRADVDRLGLIFREGLRAERRDVVHYAALSGELSGFFRRRLPELLRERRAGLLRETGGALTLIYAGGDDLLLTGAWDAVAEAAFAIQEAFTSYTSNPSLTLSAGFVVAHAHVPFRTQALLAGEGEDLAKEAGRDRISPLYAPPPVESRATKAPDGALTFRWDDLRGQIESVARPLAAAMLALDPARRDRGVSRKVLYRLGELGRIWRDHERYAFPQIYWLLARTREDLERRTGRGSPVARDWATLSPRLAQCSTLRALPVLCTWLDLLARG